MIYRTAEAIATRAQNKDGLAERRAINKDYRQQDQSALWPIRGRFNVTARAMRHVNEFERSNGAVAGLEYCYILEDAMSRIVNDESNW